MRQTCGIRVQFLEEFAFPDPYTPGTTRTDIFFAIHEDDQPKLNAARREAANGPNPDNHPALQLRWLEDVLMPINYIDPLYPSRVFEYVKAWPKIAPGMEYVAIERADLLDAMSVAAAEGESASEADEREKLSPGGSSKAKKH